NRHSNICTLFKLIFHQQRTDIGMTIQAYLRESEEDAKSLIEWAKQRGNPITIRLVKGAYWDQETINAEQNHWQQPVYNDKAATDINFEKITQLLLENHQYIYSAIGSHNVRSQAKAIAIAQSLNIPQRNFEMQVLYGMGDKIAKSLVEQGYRVRVYCPYGELLPGMAYLIRRLLENTANSSFIRQDMENRPIEELISPPVIKEEKEISIPSTPSTPSSPSPLSSFPSPPSPLSSFNPAADSDYAMEELRKKSQV
ncbi:MAG: proline dehydrogenase family protein, partial [Cyanobacteria bacterium J06643_5]